MCKHKFKNNVKYLKLLEDDTDIEMFPVDTTTTEPWRSQNTTAAASRRYLRLSFLMFRHTVSKHFMSTSCTCLKLACTGALGGLLY